MLMPIVALTSGITGVSITTIVRPLVLAAMIGIACVPADPGYSMYIENATSQTVTVYELGAYSSGDRGFTLGPGETKVTHWLRPRDENDKQDTIVRATNTTGSVV